MARGSGKPWFTAGAPPAGALVPAAALGLGCRLLRLAVRRCGAAVRLAVLDSSAPRAQSRSTQALRRWATGRTTCAGSTCLRARSGDCMFLIAVAPSFCRTARSLASSTAAPAGCAAAAASGTARPASTCRSARPPTAATRWARTWRRGSSRCAADPPACAGAARRAPCCRRRRSPASAGRTPRLGVGLRNCLSRAPGVPSCAPSNGVLRQAARPATES